jgi:hypothetical protein
VTQTSECAPRQLSNAARWLLAFMAVGLLAALATAVCLRPDPRGLGTHEQLGLPPCTFHVLVGRCCPFCGMTTSWTWLMQGNVWQAARANAGGVLLAVAAIVAWPWLLASAVRGRWVGVRPGQRVLAVAGLVAGIVILADWLRRLGIF